MMIQDKEILELVAEQTKLWNEENTPENQKARIDVHKRILKRQAILMKKKEREERD